MSAAICRMGFAEGAEAVVVHMHPVIAGGVGAHEVAGVVEPGARPVDIGEDREGPVDSLANQAGRPGDSHLDSARHRLRPAHDVRAQRRRRVDVKAEWHRSRPSSYAPGEVVPAGGPPAPPPGWPPGCSPGPGEAPVTPR